MKIAVLGTGMVGKTIGSALIKAGHEVRMGSRTRGNEKALQWVADNGAQASEGAFADAAAFGDLVFVATKGDATLDALRAAGAANLEGKVLVDISNPLDFSKGMPPSLFVCNTDSLGEQIQAAFPAAKVVKTLNIVNCEVMVDAGRSSAQARGTMFVSGNDPAAKKLVTELFLKPWGWDDVIDLGDITTARGTEMMLPIWVRTWAATGNGHFAFKVVR
ncbi:MAG: NAD(P)-binding domain-containing protein [Saprospiraceae bacterium]|nr:NAD(P)-binding domain-containing protein [Saprospiraceae bacterium]MCB0573164.1 NAD(P)-binding domain-containing protein [Saprospiraceae bacterium]